MNTFVSVLCVFWAATLASAGEVLFDSGPQQYAGRNYYWLAQWKLEVTLPDDVDDRDELEVLFGSKRSGKRSLYFTCDGQTGQVAEVFDDGYTWREIPLGKLKRGGKVVLYGKGRPQVAFLAGVRIVGKSTGKIVVRPIRVAAAVGNRVAKPLVWADSSRIPA